MKLHVLSDLHTEFADFSPPDTDADVVILAGDIGVGFGGIEWAASSFTKVPVIYVPGNHEYYGHDITLIDELVKQSPPNIHVLNNDKLVFNGGRFLGSIETYHPELWIHGHTHVPCDYELFKTRIVCNPRGYPGEYHEPGFREDLLVTIDGSTTRILV